LRELERVGASPSDNRNPKGDPNHCLDTVTPLRINSEAPLRGPLRAGRLALRVLVPVERVVLVGLVAVVLRGRTRIADAACACGRLTAGDAHVLRLAVPGDLPAVFPRASGLGFGAGGFFDVGGAVHACSISLRPAECKRVERNF